ncbi:MAG: hypothetical protein RBT75_06935 [Anaerolineae bacterium]|jgi:hypothetical protein|nr:hypothetical protein [Anaerolineae bacterium]
MVGLLVVLAVAIIVWLGVGARGRNKEIIWQIKSEIEGVELEWEEDSLKTYLDKLGLWPIGQTEIYSQTRGGWQKMEQDVDQVVFRIKEMGSLTTDIKQSQEVSGRLGKTRGGQEVSLIQFTSPVINKGVLDFLVYVNWQAIGGGGDQNRAESLSYIVLEMADFGLRGRDKEEDRDRRLMERLGERISPYIEIRPKTGLKRGLVKTALAQYCSGLTLCEENHEIYQCVGGAFNGFACGGEWDSASCRGGACTYIRTECWQGADPIGVDCVYQGTARCGGVCPPGRCDIGGCGWAWFPNPGDPTPTPPGPTTPPVTCETAGGSTAGAVVYVYEDSARRYRPAIMSFQNLSR